jgi:hypothetical protein
MSFLDRNDQSSEASYAIESGVVAWEALEPIPDSRSMTISVGAVEAMRRREGPIADHVPGEYVP